MTARVKLLAILRERAGHDTIEVELPVGATVAEALTRPVADPGPGAIVCFQGVTREAIDRIEAEAPIGKREVEAGGSRWVEGAAAPEPEAAA